MKKRLKINGIIIALAVVTLAVFPDLFLRAKRMSFQEELFKVFGFALILLGQLMRASARGYKSDNSKRGVTLIIGGPYGAVRNPMYLGILLIGLGIVLMLFNWWAAGVFLTVFILRYITLILAEEKKLAVLFQEEYVKYCRNTPRIFLPLSIALRLDIAEYLPLKIIWIQRELCSIIPVWCAALFFEVFNDVRIRGPMVYKEEFLGILATFIFFIMLALSLHKQTIRQQKNATGQGQNTA